MPVAFVPRQASLDPLAVVGLGGVARVLGERLLRDTDEQLQRVRGVAGPQILVVLGVSEHLPWVDGVTYLGRDADAPRLLLPTALRPGVALDAFERAVIHRAAGEAPWAILTSPPRIVSLGSARPIERAALKMWLGAT